MSKLDEFIQQINYHTKNEAIKWHQTQQSDIFQAFFPNHSVQITYEKLIYPTKTKYYLSIYNEEGELIEDISEDDTSIDNTNLLLAEVYQTARRQAMGLDQAINDILSDLPPF